MFAKDSVYVHINVQDVKNKDAHIAGRVFFLKKVNLCIYIFFFVFSLNTNFNMSNC